MRLLVVEDEADLRGLIATALSRLGFAVDQASTLALAEDALGAARYEAIVLDRGLPDGDGLTLLRKLRAAADQTPVLLLTAMDALPDRLQGLDGGADDYMVKPVALEELAARIRAVLRRPNGSLGSTLTAGNLVFDPAKRQAIVDARNIGLSTREATLLEILLRRPGNVVTRDRLEEALYAFGQEPGSNSLEVMIHRLRRKLSAGGAAVGITTIRGIGYMVET